jgi:hypothetical protein
MSFKTIVAWAANGALKAVGGQAGTIAGAPIGDIKTGAGALILVLGDVKDKKINLANGATALAAIQNLLVDAGVEPKIVEEMIMLALTAFPLIIQLDKNLGMVDPLKAAPRTDGLPMTEGNWSGTPEENNADNPSGEIGGDV